MVIYVKFHFLHDVACQNLLKSANVSWSYSKNKSDTYYLRHCAYNFYTKLQTKDKTPKGGNTRTNIQGEISE